jgi:hypothetical protein
MSTKIAKTIPTKSALANSCRAGGSFGSSLMPSRSAIDTGFSGGAIQLQPRNARRSAGKRIIRIMMSPTARMPNCTLA